jgi:hypothetical protein
MTPLLNGVLTLYTPLLTIAASDKLSVYKHENKRQPCTMQGGHGVLLSQRHASARLLRRLNIVVCGAP